MKYELAVFDLDGTVLNTLEDLHASLCAALQSCGYPPRSLSEVRRFVGNGIRKLVERGLPAGQTEGEIDRVYAAFREHYRVHCRDHTRPYDGIPELLLHLKQEGVLVACLSNKDDEAVQTLCARFFPGLFDAAAGSKPGSPRKPAPDAVWSLLQTMHVDRKNAVYIGDSEVDIETAKRAGIDGISVTWGFRDREELQSKGGVLFADHPADLAALLHV